MSTSRASRASRTILCLVSFAVGLAAQTGCGVLLGNVKPVDEKSTSYGIADLSATDKDWVKLDASKSGGAREEGETPTEVSDVAYQSRRTASIISLNSACRASVESQHRDLKALTGMLFLGMTDITYREEVGTEIQNNPALQTTIRGKLNGEDMMLRTVVLRRRNCIYDLLYLSRPKHFAQQETDFSHFVASLRLK